MVSIVKPNNHGDSGAWGPIVNTALDALNAGIEDVRSNAVNISTLAQPSGVATLDGSGIVAQSPQAHTHAVTVQDSGSTTYYTGDHLDMYFGSGNVVYDAVNNKIKVLATPADVRTLVVANDLVVTNSSTLTAASDLQLNLDNANTDCFDVDGVLYFQSSAAALFKVQWQTSGTSPTMLGLVFGPTEGVNNGGSDALNAATLRTAVISVPTNGSQHFGGFPASGVGLSWCKFHFRVKAGSTTGNLNIKVAQVNATTDVSKLLAGSKMFVNRVS